MQSNALFDMFFTFRNHDHQFLFYVKLIHAIYYADNLKTYLVFIMGHLGVTSDPVDWHGYPRNIWRRRHKLHKISLSDIILLFR